MGNPVVHFEIGGKNAEKMREFYGGLFDWELEVHDIMGGYTTAAVGEGGIGGGIVECGPGMPPNYTAFYVQVDDVQATLDKAAAKGASTLLEPMPIEGVGTVAMLSDPDGNAIGLITMVEE